jgi:PTS system nitrogen regulatory IIA component
MFFLVCSIDDRGHLRILARLSRLLADPELLPGLRQAPDAQAAHDLIVACESTLPNQGEA